MDDEIRALIDALDLAPLPVEGTLFVQTYRSAARDAAGNSVGSAMIGLYCAEPRSYSCFHRLTADEVWHAYAGDPFHLILLHPDGTSEEIVMGRDVAAGQRVQAVVPAGSWQAGEVMPGGRYALFGCTMAPGFTPAGFEASHPEPLIARWPDRADDIRRLRPLGDDLVFPTAT
jgi:predicted cupin superfamily sugar epimerase